LSNRVTYFAFCYLPPEKSVFYDRGSDEIDLFQNLEDSIGDFKSNGRVIVTGDLNARTGTRADYIEHDEMSQEIANSLIGFDYYSDLYLGERKNMDKQLNTLQWQCCQNTYSGKWKMCC
jgi:hypothetical protein